PPHFFCYNIIVARQNNSSIVAQARNRKKLHSKNIGALPLTFVFFCLETKEKKQKKNSRL
ncbi:MAG: hypothetical protein J6W45_07130, partial [Bacteroidales bacterium]|nr:hypothetical protein [Bacteroidales bacterium]